MNLFRATWLIISGTIASAAAEAGTAFFEKEIAPILEQRCYKCHSHKSGKAKNGLVLDSRSGWEKGGGSGPAPLSETYPAGSKTSEVAALLLTVVLLAVASNGDG